VGYERQRRMDCDCTDIVRMCWAQLAKIHVSIVGKTLTFEGSDFLYSISVTIPLH
jgi:hypothetical protein